MSSKKHEKKHGKLIGFIIALVVLCGVFYIAYNDLKKIIPTPKPGPVYTVTESELVKVLKESQLHTAEYPYNSYVEIKDDSGKNTAYYVAYNGTVRAGFDVTDVSVSLSDDNSTITIQLPKISITDVTVDEGSLEYIFVDNKYNTETVASEAYKAACEDLQKKADADTDIIDVATENAKAIEKELVEPWVNQVDKDHQYTVNVLAFGETTDSASTEQSEEQTNE